MGSEVAVLQPQRLTMVPVGLKTKGSTCRALQHATNFKPDLSDSTRTDSSLELGHKKRSFSSVTRF